MTIKKITLQYTKISSNYRFTCTTASSSNIVAVGDFMALVALEAFKDADKLELLVKPGPATPFASRILVGVGVDEVEFVPDPQENGAYKFAASSEGVARVAQSGCGLLVQVRVENVNREFGIGLVAVKRSDLFKPSGGLTLIKLPAPSPTIGGFPSIGTIVHPAIPFLPDDGLPKVLKEEGPLPRGGLNN